MDQEEIDRLTELKDDLSKASDNATIFCRSRESAAGSGKRCN
ncbi:hypothetical protein [Mesorhizobium sp. B2-6-4]|nr:hypothetical protein [Mesorhizobium sp. B2-6-4]